MKRPYKIGVLALVFIFVALVGVPKFVDNVRAGIPKKEPMYYAGMLKAAGKAVNGQKLSIEVAFWTSETQTDATTYRVCSTTKQTTPVQGRFRIPLADACTTAVQKNPDLWV